MDDDRRNDHKGAVKHGTDDGCINRRSSMFALRLVTLDHYLAAPSAPLDPLVSKLGGWEVWQVPVLRIFGVTPAGQKACLHVHGALPYLTVPCSEPRPERVAVVLASEIDLLLNTAAGRATSMHRHVHHVAVFRGMRLYGFHDREETFLRIYLYNPNHVPKVAELLLSGHVLKQTMQPHEAHIPYSLQFMIDHNLHGMSFVRVESFKFRRPLSWAHDDRSKALGSGPGIWSLRNLPVELLGDLEKQTTCELELDCCAKDILNASEKEALNPGLAALWQEEEERRQEPVSWAPLSLEEDGFPPTESELFYLARLDKLLTRPAMEEQDLTGVGKQPRKKHHSRLLDTSFGILDSQDEELAEALAQAASRWHQSGTNDEDSILGSLPAPDNVVDEEEDNDIEDMSQVFQLAGDQEQDNDGESSMSDHSDGNEAYDPFQLDGADDQPAGASGGMRATTTRDQGTQTGARPPVLVRQLLGRARACRYTRLSLNRQQRHLQLLRKEQPPVKSTGAEGRHRPGEALGSSPPVPEDWQRWQSSHVASMLMGPSEANSLPSGCESGRSPSLSIKSHETTSSLLDAMRPCSVELQRLTDEEIGQWQHRQEPRGRRRWRLRDLDKPVLNSTVQVKGLPEPKKQRRKRGLSTDSSIDSQPSASVRQRTVSVNSVLARAKQSMNSEARSMDLGYRTRRVSYNSASGDGEVSNRRAKAGALRTSKRVKVTGDPSTTDRTLREMELRKEVDKRRARDGVTASTSDTGSPVPSTAAATGGLGTGLTVSPVKEGVPPLRRESNLSGKHHLAVEAIESVPDSDASSSSLSSSSHVVAKSSDTEGSGSRPSIICRIRIQGKHGVISTTSTRPRVVGFVSPERSTTERLTQDHASPPTFGASEPSSNAIVGTQMSDGPTSDGPMSSATPLSPLMTSPGQALKIKFSKSKSSSPTPEAVQARLTSSDMTLTSEVSESPAMCMSPEVPDPVQELRSKVSKRSKSNAVAPETSAVHLGSSEQSPRPNSVTSLSTLANPKVEDSNVTLRRTKSLRKSKSGIATPEAHVTQFESSEAICTLGSPESAAAPSSLEGADDRAPLKTKFSRKSKSSNVTLESPVHMENSESTAVSNNSASLATHLNCESVGSGVVSRRPRKSKSSTAEPGPPAVHLESAEAFHTSDATTCLSTPLSTEMADSGEARQPKSLRRSKLRTAAHDTSAVNSESHKARNVADTPESPTAPSTAPLISEVADHSMALRVKSSRKSKSSMSKPEALAAHLGSLEVTHLPNAHGPASTPLRSDAEDSGVVLRPKRSRTTKSGPVTSEATQEHLESSEVSNSVLRPESSRKNRSNIMSREARETQLESLKASPSRVSPAVVELGAPEASTHCPSSRRSTRSASDVGSKNANLTSSVVVSKETEFPESFSSSSASIGNIENQKLVPLVVGSDVTPTTSQSGSDVDAAQEPGNIVPVSKRSRRRTKSAVVLYSGSESRDATDITSDDSTVHSESAVLPPTRRTRRQAARSRLSLKKVSAASLSSAESVTSTSSCEAWTGGLTEMSLSKQEILGKQASGVEPTSSSKVGRSSRFRANSFNAPSSLSSESTNTAELGGAPTVQGVAQAAKSSKSEVKVRGSSRISASKLALRSKIRKEKSEDQPSGSELQNDNCSVGDASRTCAPAFDAGVASTASANVVTSNGSSLDSASCSTSFAKLVSNHSGTRLVSSGLQVTSSSMPDMVVSIEEPGGPETVGAHERLMSMTRRLSSPSSRQELGGLPIRSSKSRKRTGLPEAPDPRIQELLVTYERLTITTPSELSGDDSNGIKQPSVAQPSTSFNLLDAAGSGDLPQETLSNGAAGSVWKESTEKYGSDRKPEAEPSYRSNIVTKESVSANTVSSSNMCEVADTSVLMEGATEGKENSPESLPAPPVPNSAASKPDVTDYNILPCSLSTSSNDVTPKKLEAPLLHTKQHQCDVPACDVPVTGNITIPEVTTNKPSIEPAAPEEVNASDLAAANSPATTNKVADFSGPQPVGPLQGSDSVISVHEVKVSDPVAKPDVPDVARTDAPVDKLLHNSDDRNVTSSSHSRPVSTPSNVPAEPLTALMSSDFDSSSSSAINTAIERSRRHVVSPSEQGSSGLLDSRDAVQKCHAADPVDEFNWSLELDQNVTKGCSGEVYGMAGAPEVVASPCGQKGSKSPTASNDDGLPKAETSSHAGSEEATAEQASGVDSVNSVEVSSADEEFPEDDAEWILLDEVRDDSAELFSSPEESIAADCSDSCGDDTNVENSVPASEVNCVNAGVSKKKDVDMIDDIGNPCKGVMDSASNEKGVHQDSIQHCSRESKSKSVGSVCKGSSTDANHDTACGSPVENINCVDDVPSENSVVHSGSESCSEAASSAEQLTISSETLANNNCEEILRNIGSDTSMIDVDSESFLEPESAKCMDETAEEDCADITSADLVHDFSSGNCDGDIGSEGMEFFASENFIEDIGSEESMELFSGSDSESKNQRDAVTFDKSNDDSRQDEDTYAMVAAGKSARVVIERLDNIDASSAIGMLYHQAKKALTYNRASCKAVKISKREHEGRPDSSEPHHAGIEKKDKIVSRSTARKSSASHQQTLKPSISLHKDVRAPSSQSRERRSSDSQAQHRSPRELDSSVKPVSAEKAPTPEKTSKFSKISRKSLSASGSRHSWGDPHAQHAQHANTGKQDGSVAPFSEDKSSSSAKLSSESSKVLQKSQLDTHKQHLKKSTHGLKAKPPGAKKKGQSANPLSVEKSSNGSQKASASSKTLSQNFKIAKAKGSDASLNKAEAQQAVADKKGDCVDSCSLGKSPSHDREASKSSKTSRRDNKVAKNKGRDANLSETETQHAVTEKIGGSVDSHLLEKSPSHDQEGSKSSRTSCRDLKVAKNKDKHASLDKAEALQAVPGKKGDSVESCSLEKSPSHDQETSKSSKTSRWNSKVVKDKGSDAGLDKVDAQLAVTEKHGGSVDSCPFEKSPSHDQEASKSFKTSCHDLKVTKNTYRGTSPNKEAQQAVTEEQVDNLDPFSLQKSPICDEEMPKSSEMYHWDFNVDKNKDGDSNANEAEAHPAVTEKQGDSVHLSSLEKTPSHDLHASKSSSPLHKDVSDCDNHVLVVANHEQQPHIQEDQEAGSHMQQQDECATSLHMERSEPVPPTDMGNVPGLLDQALDLGEIPDAIKCLLDSEVPLPELDADCFSLPPDSARWLSEEGMVEKRKLDERPQPKEDPTPFCPSSDIVLGDLTKACSLTNEGLVALVPAVPPPVYGPQFNNSNVPRVRKKCLRGLAHWQKTKLEAFARDSCFEVDFEHNPELRIAFCRDRNVVLTPARSAPTVALLAPTHQRPPPSPDDDVVSIRELPPSDASPDPAMLLVSPPSTPPRHETSTSQLDGPSGRFALSGARLPADTERVLTVLSVEVHVRTRSDLRPDPAHDPVQCVLWCARGFGVDTPLEAGAMHWWTGDPRHVDIEGIAGASLRLTGVATPALRTQVVRSEVDLLHALVDLVHRWDPDVLLGYDIERASWGYLFERAEHLDLDLYARLSRAPPPPGRKDVLGRILLCVWRILRKEVALNIYTFENTYYHVMHRRVPLYSFRLLSEWFSKDLFRWRTVEHYALRARGNLELLDELNVFGKTSQMARIFGIQFYEVLSRGSQFRVESLLLRLARSHRMVALSPSITQRSRQRAPEFIPLVLEPRAQLYTDPVVVLDFQSLYPSVIIAHNYCFSTCLGRIESFGSSAPFGCSSLEVHLPNVKSLRDHITVSPAGVAFVKSSIRRGLLPQMLDEVLGTRIMVKKAMSQCTNKSLRRVLDAQQLSLKLIANVTYGYTAAGFSGRMPCVEVADSVVSKGREALEQAIRTAEALVPGARVVYGDTDSLFVLLEGRTREEAFRLGQEIADRVTGQNPRPMRLKLEKVYQPCVLQTKKRYVGFAYESPDQLEPKYDAKGIETVRRDTCPAVAKLLEKMLRVLFTSRELVAVKRFVKLQFSKILAERVSPQDYIFAREFRGLHGYQPSACVPALEIARRQLRRDPRAEPLVGERVPYVVVYGHPGQRLIELVRAPLELLSGQLRLNAHYYVARVIGPALNRVLRLLGADCLQWYEELPRPRFVSAPRPGTMAAYVVVNQLCVACGGQAESRQLCASCEADPAYAALVLGGKVQRVQKALLELQTVCHSCMGFQAGSVCLSLDCPVLFKTSRVTTEAQQALEWNSARNRVPAST